MRKPASCVLSIALSLVMTVGFIPSPALAEIASAPEPAAQSAGKPNESPAETTSGQARANDQISAASGTNVTANATQPIDASMFSIEDTDIRYTGNPVMPTVTSSTVPSDQYTVAYENNVAIGQATAVVTADDQNYSGTCAIPFEIKPANAAANYQHSTTAQSGDITLTVQWNDPRLGQETTFHVTATGGSGAHQFRMDAPTYMDPDGSSESVADPSRNQWQQYTGECTSHDYQFEMTASGTYYLRFYLMDKAAGVYYLRSNVFASANDDAYPAVSAIVKSAVDKCSADTDGSDYARALWLHDWALDQLGYDHSLNWCSAESGLTRHQGTCESYQRIYSKLLDAAGIANGRITGNGHTWNAVKIDGKWCQMDLTWDDTSDNWYGDLDQRHLYFGLTDELMAIAHSDHTANYQKDGYAYRSTDLSNNYFVRNGKADEWAEKYADRIQQHLNAKEESFSIDADNQSFPPSISGIQNGFVAYAMNQREWKSGDAKVELVATSNVIKIDVYHWAVSYEFKASHQRPAHSAPLADGDYRLLSPDGSLGVGAGPTAAESGAASALSFERDAGSGSYTITDKSSGKALTARALELNGPVTMEEPDGSAAQLWDVTANGDGTLRIQPASDHSLTADMCGAWSRGSRMLLWACGPVENQRFVAGAAAPLADGDYRLLSPDGSLGVGAGPTAAESGAASALSFERDAGSGSYTITDKSSGKALTARALELNGPVTMEEPDGSAAQLWDVTANGDGTLRIQPASDHSLTADMCGAWSRGSRMLLWACGPVENQRFVAGAEKS